jgi:predicted phosphodiesterase
MSLETRIAVLSDIHGNLRALERVLHDIEHRGLRDIVNLGDSLYGPLDPAGTADVLMRLDIPTVLGNEDRVLLVPGEDSSGVRWAREALRQEHLRWLEGLEPAVIVQEHFFLCHGSPDSDTEYLLRKVTPAGAVPREPDGISGMISTVKQPVLLCGHDHVPGSVLLPCGRLVVDPGSVGLPAYSDDTPHPHVMEAGTPHARYSIVSLGEEGWLIENVCVPYCWSGAAEDARRNGRPDWAEWLATGRAWLPMRE